MKTHLTCLAWLLLFSGVVAAQESTSIQQAQDLADKATEAYRKGEYPQAIDSYLEALSYPDMERQKGGIFYNVSCCYSLLGDSEKALAYLDSTVEAGYSNYRWLNEDGDFAFLRERHGERFKQIVARAKAHKEKEILQNSLLIVIEYDNYRGPLDISGYDWGDIRRAEMDTLREKYRLREVIGQEGTEFDKMKRMLNWVATRWVHDGSKMAPKRTALAILDEVARGGRFCCANYADVLIGCMQALGYPIRFVGLRTEDAAYDMGGGHGCVEVWSNQYQKWILLDVQNNAWWEHEGVPLNAYECHRLFTGGRESELQFVGQHENVDYAKMRPIWSAYFHHVVSYWMGRGLCLLEDTSEPQLVYQSHFENLVVTDQHDEVYPSLNRTKITLRGDRNGDLDSLTVVLDHTMPYFDRFLVRIDQKEWQSAAETLTWALKDGRNTIEAKAVNVAGVEGRPSRIVLLRNQ